MDYYTSLSLLNCIHQVFNILFFVLSFIVYYYFLGMLVVGVPLVLFVLFKLKSERKTTSVIAILVFYPLLLVLLFLPKEMQKDLGASGYERKN